MTRSQAPTPNPRVVVGIDPGIQGAVAVLMEGEGARVWDMPTNEFTLFAMIEKTLDITPISAIIIEDVSTCAPRNGRKGMATFYAHFGKLQFIPAVLGLPLLLARPQAWMKGLGLPPKRSADDKPAWAWAREEFPDVELVTPRGRKLDGRADALGIAAWGLKQLRR